MTILPIFFADKGRNMLKAIGTGLRAGKGLFVDTSLTGDVESGTSMGASRFVEVEVWE